MVTCHTAQALEAAQDWRVEIEVPSHVSTGLGAWEIPR